jgi:hypothetical protein
LGHFAAEGKAMIETVVLVGGPLDGRQFGSKGGNSLSLPAAGENGRRLEYRRAHDESKFFHFQPMN